MQCKCGSETIERGHRVKRLNTARQWLGDGWDGDLPVLIKYEICKACGRMLRWPYAVDENKE